MRARQSGWLLAVGVGCLLVTASAQAETTTDRPGSILMFPKVVRDGTRDTIIQITNTGNLVDAVHCFYLNGEASRSGAPLCTETDFDIVLTRQQPTQWRVSTGRTVNLNDSLQTPGAGYDPGLIPPVPLGFTGALVCAEVSTDGSLTPVAMNRLKGEATLQRLSNGDASKYNAVAVQGATPNTDDNLVLNNVEYNRCPGTLRTSFLADGGLDPVIEAYGSGNGASSVVNNITLLPCNLDFRNGVSTTGTVSFDVWDEFEVHASGSFPFACWTSFNLGSIAQFRSNLLNSGGLATIFANAQFTGSTPVVGVLESFHADSFGVTASAAVNLHDTAGSTDATIRLP